MDEGTRTMRERVQSVIDVWSRGTTDHRGRARTTGRVFVMWTSLLGVVVLIASFLALQGTPASAAVTPINGTMVEGSLTGTTGPALTLPRGAVWVPDGTGVPAGGHWWATDQVLGICSRRPDRRGQRAAVHVDELQRRWDEVGWADRGR